MGTRALGVGLLVVAVVTASCRGAAEAPFPALTPFPADLEERLHSIRDHVSEVRGLPVNDETVEGLVDRETFRQYVGQVMSEVDEDDRREMEAWNAAFRLLHLMGPEDDLLQLVTQDMAENVVGVYVPDENRLALIDNSAVLDNEDEFILAHEYVHSFQEGSLDMERLAKLVDEQEDDSPRDYGTTISCLKEGDASVAAFLYAEENLGPDWFESPDSTTDEEEPEAMPPAVERYLAFDYVECVGFAWSLYDAYDWKTIDEAYEDPPWTTEQILHPEKYLSHEDVTDMAPMDLSEDLPQGWTRLYLLPFGEFDVYNYLLTINGYERTAAQGAAGWGSGWMAVYGADGNAVQSQHVLVHIALEWDSSEDLVEFMGAYGGVVEMVSDGDWELIDRDGPARWVADGEFGYVKWSEEQAQVHVLVSTDEAALEAAAAGLPF